MKVFVLYNVLCDYTCGCIIVSAKNKKEAIKIIKDKRARALDSPYATRSNIEDHMEEVGKGYYSEVGRRLRNDNIENN